MKRIYFLRAAIVTGGLLFAGLLAAVAVLYLNQKQITRWAVEKANEGFTGTLEVSSSRILLFHDFPYVDIDLQGVAFYGDKEKKEEPLYQVADVYLGFRWIDVLRSKFNIKLIAIEGGRARIVQQADGNLNILLAKNIKAGTGEESDTAALHLQLKKLIVKNVDVSFYSEADSTHFSARIERVETKVKLRHSQLELKLKAATRVSLTRRGNPTFLTDKVVTLNTDLDYDQAAKTLRLRKTNIGFVDAVYGASGEVRLADSVWCNLKVFGEKQDFSLLTAFAPANIHEQLKKYRQAGEVFFEGTVAGVVSATQQPRIDIRFGCENGFFQNVQSDTKVQELTLAGTFSNGPGRSLATSVFELQKVSLKPDRGAFQGSVRIENFTDPKIAVTLASDIDLEFLGQFLGVEGLQRLRGNVIVTMNFNEIFDFSNPELTLLRLKEGVESELSVRDLSFVIPGYQHPIEQLDLHAEMRNGIVVMDTLAIRVADSDLQFTGSLSNLPALFHKQDVSVIFKAEGTSTRLNLTSLSQADPAQAALLNEEISDLKIKMAFETSVRKLQERPLPWGEFFIEDLYAKIKGYPHTLHDVHADVIITDSTFQLKDFSGEIDQSDFHFNGRLTNYNIWFDSLKNGDTVFEFDLYSEQLRLNDLLTYQGENYLPEEYRHEVAKELKLHGLLDLNFNGRFRFADLLMERVEARLNVHPLKIEKMQGRIHYEDDFVSVQNLAVHLGPNDMLINLKYYTRPDSLQKKRENRFTIQSNYLNLDQLLAFNPAPAKPKDHARAFNIFEIPFTHMGFAADIKKLKHHQVDVANLILSARTTPDHYLFLDTLAMDIAQGRFALSGYLNGSNPKKIYFQSTASAQQLDLDKLFFKFDNFGQDVMPGNTLHGRLSGRVISRFLVHPDLTPILDTGEAQLDLSVVKGSLTNFAPLRAMASFFQDRNLNNVRFDTLQNNFTLKNAVLTIPAMTINSSLGFIELEGTQTLDKKMDLLVRVPLQLVTQVGFQALFKGRRREEVDPDQEDAIQFRDNNRRTRFLNVRVRGTPDNVTFALGRRSR